MFKFIFKDRDGRENLGEYKMFAVPRFGDEIHVSNKTRFLVVEILYFAFELDKNAGDTAGIIIVQVL